jgi:redox-sensitive bicupin YhaK (pirin superfamily)
VRGGPQLGEVLRRVAGIILQLWVNLPRADKKMSPEYEAVHGRDLPEDGRNGVVVRTVVGAGSKVRLRTDVRYLDVKLEAGRRFEQGILADRSSLLYVLDGHVRVGDVELARGEGVQPREGELTVASLDAARVLLVSGQRHHEPIVHHGPFVD